MQPATFTIEKTGDTFFRGRRITREELIRILEGLARSYPLFMIEDPLDEDDFEGFAEITKRVNLLIVGDDLFVTNLERLKRGIAHGSSQRDDPQTQYGWDPF